MGRDERLRALDGGRQARGRGRVVVGYPVGFSVTLPFHASVIRLLHYELAKPDHERLLARIMHTSGLYIADNRTMLVQRFLETPEADWLLQVDTDIEFPRDLLETMVRLAGATRKVLAASVPLGVYPSCAFKRAATVGVWDTVWPVPMTPVRVDGIATAAVLVHRAVFEAIARESGHNWFHHIYVPESATGTPMRDFRWRSVGEDLAFSLRAADAGFGVWCAHVPGLRHHKTRPLSHDDERAARLAAEDDSAMGEIVAEG